MDITGFDTVVFTRRRPRKVLRLVRAGVLARWPGALVDDLENPGPDPGPVSALRPHRLPAKAAHLLFHRDAAMARHMDAAGGYAPMADGDGPFAVTARPRRGVEFRLDRVTPVRAAGEADAAAGEPHPAWLCTPLVYEITVVTPGDPDADPFSAWASETVRQACGGWV